MTNELTTPQNTSISTETKNTWVNSPEDQKDLIFPRAKIFQGTATEFESHPNAKPGMIINHITGEELTGTFIPFLRFKQYVKFNPRNSKEDGFDESREPGALIWMTTDSNDTRVKECKFGENGEKPTAVEFMNFMCIFEGCDFPIIVPFCKTSMKAGKKLYSMLAFSGSGLNRKFTLLTKKQQKDGSTYYTYDVNPAGIASEEEALKANTFHSQFSQKTKEIAEEEVVQAAWAE
jgi:hypothetical protein